ncbi:hypothetical protein RND81_14G178100 [Saponaria officinalis]|uniref:Lipoyl-binding domain-containing protein n=2 Tax=Saponaria officinalis TaxID=3572 RepID=A0AAW1GXI0_SAPOF
MSASGNFGAPNTQIMSSKVNLKSRHGMQFPPNALHVGSWPKAWRSTHMKVLQRSNKVSKICCAQLSLTADSEPVTPRLEKGGEKKPCVPVSQLIPNSNEVMSLLSDICETISIAEFELKLDGFHLHVTRALLSSGVTDPRPPAPRQPPVPSVSAGTSTSSYTASKEPSPSNQVFTTSLALTKSGPLGIKSRALLERAADEGLVIIQSPKVGFFRRCRTIKGKRAPPASKEKQAVKEGQVVCYIEQLGWEAPIESDVSGEITKFLCEDGEPVGFGDPIIAVLPSFPGIKKLPAER